MKRYLFSLLFLALFLMESLFVQYLPGELFGKICAPHFLFTGILFLTIFVNQKQGILHGIIFGLIFDIVNTEILGIYMFLFPLVAFLISKMLNMVNQNLVVSFLFSLLGIALLEIGVYEMNSLIHVTNMDFMTFINMRLYPTLILNAVFIIIAGYPLKRQLEKIAVGMKE